MSAKFKIISNDFGDGDDEDFVEITSVVVQKSSNGWIVTTYFDDDSEIIESFDVGGADDGDLQTIRCIAESMGLQDAVKILKR